MARSCASAGLIRTSCALVLAVTFASAQVAAEDTPSADAALAEDVSTEGTTPDPAAAASPESEASEDALFDDEFDALFSEEFEFEIEGAEGFPDPFEGFNRAILKFNHRVDLWVLRPLARGFDWISPDPLKFAMRRLFENLNTPVVFANDFLQLEWKDVGITFSAFVVNSSLGVGGLFEPGKYMGLVRHSSDFGQTLALASVPSGPYLVVPVIGPTTIRDGIGSLVNVAMRPTTWFFGLGNLIYLYSGTEMIVLIEERYVQLEELKKSSVDFYPVLRSAYYQNRVDEIWSRREHRRKDIEGSLIFGWAGGEPPEPPVQEDVAADSSAVDIARGESDDSGGAEGERTP